MRSVCKSWNAILSESFFVKSHLHHSIHNNDTILLSFSGAYKCSSFTVTARPSHSPNLELTNFIKLPPNSKPICRVIGSVNGLICIKYGLDHNDVVAIWNPSLSAMLTLPPRSSASREILFECDGFGYNPQTDDYKVVKLTTFSRGRKMATQGEVYSIRKGYWEAISQRFPSNVTLIPVRYEACVNGHKGHLHWIAYIDQKRQTQTIVAFDLGVEAFREIPLPDSICDGECFNIGALAGKLCVMSCVEYGECEVWVMDEYGVVESWVKNHTFSQFSDDIYPYGFTSHSEFFFQVDNYDEDYYALYDPVEAKTKTFKIMPDNWFVNIVEYVDSLVWIEPANRLKF